jgi:HSP20 family molecular chaperone IbpA
MAYAGYYYDFPPPLVDHIHERHHQHQNVLEYMTRRHPKPTDHPNQPDVDFRDNITEYFVEVEVPGIKNPKDISVTWTGHKALVVSGTVERPQYADEDGAVAATTGGESKKPEQHVLVGERRLGPFRRYINFPTDVENVKVSLEAGLLKIRAPKKGFSAEDGPKVDVKHDDVQEQHV